HASARNVIEHTFGVLKRCFRILLLAAEYSLDIQAQIPAALCMIHNFILVLDLAEGDLPEAPIVIIRGDAPAAAMEMGGAQDEGRVTRNNIAQAMWSDYQNILAER
ncbi:hypothetical protein PAXINDRAFT_26137, partial [Paxillus involutus ATCC 200175]